MAAQAVDLGRSLESERDRRPVRAQLDRLTLVVVDHGSCHTNRVHAIEPAIVYMRARSLEVSHLRATRRSRGGLASICAPRTPQYVHVHPTDPRIRRERGGSRGQGPRPAVRLPPGRLVWRAVTVVMSMSAGPHSTMRLSMRHVARESSRGKAPASRPLGHVARPYPPPSLEALV